MSTQVATLLKWLQRMDHSPVTPLDLKPVTKSRTLTLGYSMRQAIRVYLYQNQRHWLQALEEAFRFWQGVPYRVLVDKSPGR
jgi:hypothetical protein